MIENRSRKAHGTSPVVAKEDLVCVGLIGSARGLKGELRVKSYTAKAPDLAAYGPLSDATGKRVFDLKVTGKHKDQLVVRIKGVDDRTAAEALNGQALYAARERLPKTQEDEFYFSDLQGLEAKLADGTPFGQIVQAEDYGGGPFIEVKSLEHGHVLVPFTKAAVPVVDLKAGWVVIDLPDGLLEPGDPEPTEV